ncbi:hypothetical protein NP233_g3738 [Leucocoprinus birnbaumii]|uniref:Uncharacterized protein n=1 Tax=Leucocoprinus birnbaumii TaxID=56174 RepID=A0AAD5YSJ1_9AGAR|nr:hypothetical protein NP233_g3738 [Leucocoprinus birnbaumii]
MLLHTMSYLKHSPFIPDVLRHLELSFCDYLPLDSILYPSRKSKLVKYARKRLIPAIRAIGLADYWSPDSRIRAALKRLDRLSSIDLVWFPPSQPAKCPLALSLASNLSVAWTASYETLRSLSLTFHCTPLHGTPLPRDVKFPNLSDFKLCICETRSIAFEGPEAHWDSRGIAQFFVNHRSTIQRLTLSLSPPWLAAKILGDMPYLESLVALSLTFSLAQNPIIFPSLVAFLNAHSHIIKSYRINIHSYGAHFHELNSLGSIPGFLKMLLPFSRLDYLSISMSTHYLFSFVSKIDFPVQTLSVGSQLEFVELQELTAILKSSSSGAHLQNLYLCMEQADAGLLCLLASSFPSLKSLWIKYSCIWEYNATEVYDPFRLAAGDLSRMELNQWDPEKFYLERCFGESDHRSFRNDEEYCTALLHALPRVQYFNGLPRGFDGWIDRDVDISETPWFFEPYRTSRPEPEL